MRKKSEQDICCFLVSSDSVDDHDIKRCVADLFVCKKRTYKNQKEIAKAFREEYHKEISQGTISKVLSKLQTGFKYSNSDKTYYIVRQTSDNSYSCMNEENFREDKRYQMIDSNLFKRKDVWSIDGKPRTSVFWIAEGKMNEAIEKMKSLLGSANVLDIFDYRDKLFVVLAPNSKLNLKNFLIWNWIFFSYSLLLLNIF